jgi:hypothetical protein
VLTDCSRSQRAHSAAASPDVTQSNVGKHEPAPVPSGQRTPVSLSHYPKLMVGCGPD